MDGILAPGAFSLTLTPAPGGSGGGSYILPLDMAAAISRMPENFLWYPAEAGSPPAGLASLTLTAEDGSAALQCWEGSSLVRCTRSGVTQWFSAPPMDGTVFAALRQIYDEVEWEALREGIIIPDRGQSHLEIAQAWADADTRPPWRSQTAASSSAPMCGLWPMWIAGQICRRPPIRSNQRDMRGSGSPIPASLYRRMRRPAAVRWPATPWSTTAGTARPRRAPMRISRWGSST